MLGIGARSRDILPLFFLLTPANFSDISRSWLVKYCGLIPGYNKHTYTSRRNIPMISDSLLHILETLYESTQSLVNQQVTTETYTCKRVGISENFLLFQYL